MKRSLMLSLGACVLSVSLLAVPASAADAKSGKTITVFNLGGLDEAGLGQSVAYLSRNVPLPVHSVTLPAQTTLDGVLQAVAKARTENDAIVIAVVALKSGTSTMLADPDKAVAVLNTVAITQAYMNPASINLSMMRALAAELGVGYSVDIHCVNRRVTSPAEFQKLGGNFCPPTLQQVLISAGERGVNTTIPARKHAAPAEKK